MTTIEYAKPMEVDTLEDCWFYHTFELADGTVLSGVWDLRDGIDKYLGGMKFDGCKVLDVGAASGGLSFHIEKDAAEVYSFDIADDQMMDMVPYAKLDEQVARDTVAKHVRQVKKSYWFMHSQLQSKAKAIYGDIYNLSAHCPKVDVVVLGSILLHLRDPLKVLTEAGKLGPSTIIVTDLVPRRYFLHRLIPWAFRPTLYFKGDPKDDTGEPSADWWNVSPKFVQQVLKVMGYTDTTLSFHSHPWKGKKMLMYTVVGKRP